MSDYQTIEDMVCCAGTPSAACDFCGTIQYAVGIHSELTEDQRALYEKVGADNPGRYLSSPDDSIAFGTFDGYQIVWGCPCRKMERYEQFIWENRELIVKYIAGRNAAIAAEAAKLTTELSGIGSPQ